MKFSRPFLLLLLSGMISSCHKNQKCDEVVCETVHRYGIALEPEDWSDRGQHGQVVSMRKDGVSIKRSYDSGVLQGECTYSFPHRDVVHKKEIYDQGDLKQVVTHYPTGFPQKQTMIVSPVRNVETVWYENGAPHSQEVIDNGCLYSGEYYNIEQQLDSRIENGNGLRTIRDGHGQLQSVDTVEENQMTLRTTYHPNGNPAIMTPYFNGMIEGDRRIYSPSGEPSRIESWTADTQHGITHEFEHGEKRAEIPYVSGCRHGIESRYRDDGQTVAQEINWVQGQRHGPVTSYMGNTKTTDWYFKNQQVANKATFDMMHNQ